MDCRRTLCLAVGLVVVVAGCDQTKHFSLWPSAPAAPEKDHSAAIWEKTPLQPATLVAKATFREQHASEPKISPQVREQLNEEARLDYKRALQMDPKYVPAHIGLARFHERMGNHDRALECYAQALKFAPKEPAVWSEVGICHVRHRDWEPALVHLSKAVELDPDSRQHNKVYGLCLVRAGRLDEGLKFLRKAMTEAEAQCSAARILHDMKQDDASRHHLQLALQSNPDLNAAQQLLADLEARPAAGNPEVFDQ